MLVSSILPTTVAGFFLFGLKDEIFMKLNLYDKLIEYPDDHYNIVESGRNRQPDG